MSEATYIIDVDERNINDVVQMSTRVPVLLDFWATWCEPCKTLAPVLEKMATDYQGRFILAKVETDANPMLCQQLGVRSVPALKLIVQGQLAGELNGAQPESAIKQLLEPYLGESMPADSEEADPNDFFAQVERARAMGAFDQAIDALQAAMKEQPKEMRYPVLLAEVLMDAERTEDAEQVLNQIEDDKVKAPAVGRLFFLNELQGFDTTESLQYRVAQNSDDVEARYYMAANCVLAREYPAAMELLLEVVQKDRQFKDDGARLALLKLFDMLPGDADVVTYRRRLFTSLH